MTETDTNGWDEYRKHVLASLAENTAAHQSLFGKVDTLSDKLDRKEESAAQERLAMMDRLRGTFVSRDRYIPVERIVYALVGLICGGVLMAIVSLVIRGGK
jgi:uncharacterized protein YdcH (DUF465 family)